MAFSEEQKTIRKLQEWQFNPLQWVREVIGEEPTFQQEAALKDWGLLIRAKVKSAKNTPLSDEEKRVAHKMNVSHDAMIKNKQRLLLKASQAPSKRVSDDDAEDAA